MSRIFPVAALCLFAVACSEDGTAGSVPDSGSQDAGVSDVGVSDMRVEQPDQGGEPDVPNVEDLGTTAASPCEETSTEIACAYETLTLQTGFTGVVPRDVHYALPASPAPEGGYPVVLLFQGSLFSGELSFEATASDPFGAIHQTRLVKLLVDGGYAVLAPEAHANGSTYWDTNVPPYSVDWDLAPDHQFMLDILEAIDAGEFGALDRGSMFATGISSGGYMTSRMAVSYPGEFTALAINAGSYANCSGALCVVPDLPSDHPPTLFVMGEVDNVVPLSTAEAYHEDLMPITDTELITAPDGAHEWLSIAPDAIVEWFDTYR